MQILAHKPIMRISFTIMPNLIQNLSLIFAFLFVLITSPAIAQDAELDAAATGDVAAFLISAEPKEMPTRVFKDAEGNEVSLKDWQGKTILLNLWATWCAPCRVEKPELDALQAKMQNDDFEVVTISIDRGSISKPADYLKQIDIQNLPLYHDSKGLIFNDFRRLSLARGLPFSVLIGPDGKDLGYINGPAKWTSPDAEHLINTAIDLSKDFGS